MKDKISFYIITLIILLIICLIMVMYLINTKTSKYSNEENTNSSDITQTKKSEEYDEIFEHEDETGEAKFNESQLDEWDFEIKNLPEEVKKYLKDEKKLLEEIKKYIYFNGLVDATEAKYQKHKVDEKENELTIRFVLNNEDITKLLVKINTNTFEMQISDY